MYGGKGRVIKSNGGLFTLRLFEGNDAPLDGKCVTGRARGSLHRGGTLLVGDVVRVSYDETAFSLKDGVCVPAEDGRGLSVDVIEERKNALIRPPMANLDVLFITVAVSSPEPVLSTVDKLISIAEFNDIEPIVVLTKGDLSKDAAQHLEEIYTRAGFCVLRTGKDESDGDEALRRQISELLKGGRTGAFSGASGVGKSTLLNRLYPHLSLETGELSQRIGRGKNTTRHVELYPISDSPDAGYLADTPGFTMLDFERFDFFALEDLPTTFREFVPYIGECRYTKCSHTKEEGCAILAAVKSGEIPKSRHQSFLEIYEVLKKKTKW